MERIINKFQEKDFIKFLRNNNMSKCTIDNYCRKIKNFYNEFKEFNKDNLLLKKSYLIEERKSPKSINSFVSAVNSYIKFIFEDYDIPIIIKLKIKQVKEQQSTFLENVITVQQFKQFCNFLKSHTEFNNNSVIKPIRDKNCNNKIIGVNRYTIKKFYMIVRCLGLTGVRISELIYFNTEAVYDGYFDVNGKGGKVRRIYIPKLLQTELKEWIKDTKISGYLFTNRINNQQMTTRGIAHQLKSYARLSKIPEDVVYPHSFRHMYAKAFLAKRQDLCLLSDLLGHTNINTTRIYLRLTSAEQKSIVDKVVDW